MAGTRRPRRRGDGVAVVTATINDATDLEAPHSDCLTPAPRAFRKAARSFKHLKGADVVWLAVRESRAQNAIIRCSHGARSTAGLGLRIESGSGVGGAVLLTGQPW